MARYLIRVAMFAALFLSGPLSAGAQDARLTSRDGSIHIEGTMLGFDGEFFRLATDYGTITVDAQGVTCEGPGCPDLTRPVTEVRISGARAMGEVLMPALIETFATRNSLLPKRMIRNDAQFSYALFDPAQERTVALFHFHLTTTAEGFADLMAEEADLVMATRAVTADEVATGVDAGIGDLSGPRRARIVALDALVPVVSPRNPVRRVSLASLAAVRSGALRDWSDLDGPAAIIELHEKSDDLSLAQFLPAERTAPGADAGADWLVRHSLGAELAEAVTRSPVALGLAHYSEIGNARPLALVGACGRQITVSRETLKAEDYPLPLPLYLYVPPRRLPPVARAFLDWLTTPAAELAVRRAGYVNQVPMEIPLAAQGERMANAIAAAGGEVSLRQLKALVREMTGARRLTATFRFRDGSAQLDPQSEGNLERLARDIELGSYDEREIVLAGFSDGLGPAAANRALSLARAETVAAALRTAAPAADWERVRMRAIGLGEVLPIACDHSERNRQTNRRVEVWLR